MKWTIEVTSREDPGPLEMEWIDLFSSVLVICCFFGDMFLFFLIGFWKRKPGWLLDWWESFSSVKALEEGCKDVSRSVRCR